MSTELQDDRKWKTYPGLRKRTVYELNELSKANKMELFGWFRQKISRARIGRWTGLGETTIKRLYDVYDHMRIGAAISSAHHAEHPEVYEASWVGFDCFTESELRELCEQFVNNFNWEADDHD